MTVSLAAIIGVTTYALLRDRAERWALPAGAAAGVAAVYPLVVFPLAVVVPLLWVKQRLAQQRTRRAAVEADAPLLAELTLLGLRAGLTFPTALDRAADEVHPELGSSVHRIVRSARTVGLGKAMEGDAGPATPLLALAASAVHTGAPLADAVAGHVTRVRHDEHAGRQAEARKLPVRLLLPVSLLILPGFVVLVVGPAVLTSLERLSL